MINKCKKKGCNNEALNGEKFCNFHQSKREDTKKIFIGGVSALATCVIAVVNKSNKK